MEESEKKLKTKKQIKELLIFLGIMIAVGIVIFVVIQIKEGNKVKHPEESGMVYTSQPVYFYATGAAKAVVLDELLYPRNSEFEDDDDFFVSYNKELNQYTVKGTIYASNGFGVQKEMSFIVVLTLSNLNKDKYSYNKISCDIY